MMASWAGTYGFCVMKHGDVDPDDVYHGGVPILRHGQDHRDSIFWMTYSNEERE